MSSSHIVSIVHRFSVSAHGVLPGNGQPPFLTFFIHRESNEVLIHNNVPYKFMSLITAGHYDLRTSSLLHPQVLHAW